QFLQHGDSSITGLGSNAPVQWPAHAGESAMSRTGVSRVAGLLLRFVRPQTSVNRVADEVPARRLAVVVDREADALPSAQLLVDLADCLAGLGKCRLSAPDKARRLLFTQSLRCVNAPLLRHTGYIEDIANAFPAVGVDLPNGLDLRLRAFGGRLA